MTSKPVEVFILYLLHNSFDIPALHCDLLEGFIYLFLLSFLSNLNISFFNFGFSPFSNRGLEANQFSGIVPPELGDLTNLQTL